jgi:hypothetical protein
MNWTRGLTVLGVVVAGWLVGMVEADTYAPRQYYGGWSYYKKRDYYYRNYYYKPTKTYTGYKRHVVIYKPSVDRKHYYFYNPYSGKYWGRCPATYYGNKDYTPGQGSYSKLEPEDQKAKLSDIPQSKFPKPGNMPNIPDSKDDAQMDLPPDDPPTTAMTAE